MRVESALAAVVSGGAAKNRRHAGGTGAAWAWRGRRRRGADVARARLCCARAAAVRRRKGARVGAVGRARRLRRIGVGRRFREEEGAVTDTRGPRKD